MKKNSLGIDPSKFKHVKSDEKVTVLQHKDGHELRIAHNVLSKSMQEQLKALSNVGKEHQTETQRQEEQDKDQYGKVIHKYAEGEMVQGQKPPVVLAGQSDDAPPPRPKTNKEREKDVAKGSQRGTSIPSANVLWDRVKNAWAEGGEVQKMAEGGQPETKEASIEDLNASLANLDTNAPAPSIAIPEVKQTPLTVAMPFSNDSFTTTDPEKPIIGPAIKQAATDVKDILMAPAGTMPALQVKPADVAATKADALVEKLGAEKQSAEQVAQAAHEQAAVASEPTPSITSPESLATKGLNAELAGANMAAKAIEDQGKAKAAIMEQDIKRKRDISDNFQQSFKALNDERLAHIQDIQKGYINPDLYWTGDAQGNGSHSKIAAGIGMILAGFNPTNRPNAAIEFLNHQMDRNLDAQKQNLNAKNNLLMANLHHFKNLEDAMDMTRVMQADVVKSQIEKAADQAAGPLAKAQAQSAIGAINAKYQPIFMNLQIRQTLRNLGAGNTSAPGSTGQALSSLDMVAPEQAKQYRERYYAPYDVPGGRSIADRPIEAKDREAILSADKFDATARQLHDIIAKNRGNIKVLLDPSNPTNALAKQQAMILQQLIREGFLGTVYREGEQPLLDKVLKGDPLSLVGYFKELPKLEQLINTNQQLKNQRLESYGLMPPAAKASARQPQQQEQQQPVKGKDGRMYIRQGNFMVPVK